MKTKIKTFRFTLSKTKKETHSDHKLVYDEEKKIDDAINEFLSSVIVNEIVDIKINKVESRYHNNGGYNHIDLIYTIIYK